MVVINTVERPLQRANAQPPGVLTSQECRTSNVASNLLSAGGPVFRKRVQTTTDRKPVLYLIIVGKTGPKKYCILQTPGVPPSKTIHHHQLPAVLSSQDACDARREMFKEMRKPNKEVSRQHKLTKRTATKNCRACR